MTARPLFSQGELRAYLHSRNVALHEEVQRTSDEHVLQAQPQEWASALAEAYGVQAPVLLHEERYADEPRSTMVDVRHEGQSRAIRDRSEPALVPGREVTVQVPFDGDATVLHLTPSQFSFNRPEADVSGGALRFELEWPNDRPLDIGARVETELRLVDEYLSWARVDCEQHNRGLTQYAEAQIERRRAEIAASRAQLEKAGIPVRPAAGKRRITDAIVRRPHKPQRPQASRLVALDPELDQATYDHILNVLRLQGDAMQRSPASYAGMHEEDLRQVFLGTLHSHYAGRVSAEAFNAEGKTDLLVRDGPRAVFVAECKRWTGPKAIGDAVDQLLSYAGWHDVKLALMVFVETRDLTTSTQRARQAVETHAAFAGWQDDARHDDDLRCRLHWPGDPRRLAQMALLLVHLPPSSRDT